MIMRLLIICMAAALAILPPRGANASDNNGIYCVSGVGGQSCATVVSKLTPGDNDYISQLSEESEWVAGYLSAYNWLTPDTYSIAGFSDFQGVMTWIVDYARKHPLDPLHEAVQRLIRVLYPKRQKLGPPR